MNEVVVTGVGAACSLGHSRESLLSALAGLRSGIVSHDLLPGGKSPVRAVGLVPGFTTEDERWALWRWPGRFPVKRDALRSFAPHVLYGLCAALDALEQAGLPDHDFSASEGAGLFAASAGSTRLLHRGLRVMDETGGARGNPFGVVSAVAGTLNFNLGAYFHLRGANVGFVSACASSAHALGYASDEIRLGRLDQALVVGGEEVTAESVLPFAAMRALSLRPGPDACRPFDQSRDGFVCGGGGAALLLESAQSAKARGAVPLARFDGWAHTADGFHAIAPHPEGEGLERAIRKTLQAAGWAPARVDHINAHATGTPVGDKAEALALGRIFTAAGAHPAIAGTKALTGHGLSLAGALEAVLAILCLTEGLEPGTAFLEKPDEACAGLNLPRVSSPRPLRRVLSNSCGFGGSNVCLAFSRP